MPINSEDFRNAMSRFASGVTVVTTKDAAGDPHGITVSAFSSVSLDPPLVLICIENAAGSVHAFKQSKMFVVNVLSREQIELSERFAAQIADKFAGVDLDLDIDGIPVLSNCLVNLSCRVRNVYDGGDHTIFVGEVESSIVAEGDPLIYFRGDYHWIGKRGI
jgi:flavin reductase ActVB